MCSKADAPFITQTCICIKQTDVLSFDRTGVPLPPENLMIQNLFVPFVVQKRQDQLIIASVLSQ